MKRLALALLPASLAAGAQQPGESARLGILYGGTPAFAPETYAFDRRLVAGLRDHGYVMGQNDLGYQRRLKHTNRKGGDLVQRARYEI
jgi:hypothetical protein